MVHAGCVSIAGISPAKNVNIRICINCMMECIQMQNGPWFILSSEGIECCCHCSHAGIK